MPWPANATGPRTRTDRSDNGDEPWRTRRWKERGDDMTDRNGAPDGSTWEHDFDLLYTKVRD